MPFDDLIGWRRKLWRGLLLFVMILQLGVLGFQWSNGDKIEDTQAALDAHYISAEAYHAEKQAISDARARVLVIMTKAIKDGRAFSPEEMKEISDLWSKADFAKIEEKFLQ